MKFLAILFAVSTAVSGLVIDRDNSLPPANEVYIQDVKWAGSGCPAGSVSRSLSNDKQTVTLMFDKYMAAIGPDVSLTQSYKNCQLNLKLKTPPGWTYTIHRTQYRGYTTLDDGVSATQKSIYYFSGDTNQWTAQTTFKGPYAADYHFWDDIKKETLVFCKCGVTTALNINTSLRMQSKNVKKFGGLITTDSIDHKVYHVLGIQWKKC